MLAYGTAFNVFPHELYETWPLEFGCDKLASLKTPRVAGSLIIVATSEDGIVVGVLGGNINMSFVCENVVIILPVQKVRLEGGGDIFKRGLQMLEDKRVRLR